LLVAENELKKSGAEISTENIQRLSNLIVKFFTSSEKASLDFEIATRKRFYVTPSHCIDLLKNYSKILREGQYTLPAKIKKYETGLRKLAETREEIKDLQAKILAFQPELDRAKIENEELLKDLEVQNAVAAEKESFCEKEAQEIQTTRNQLMK
jgi:DNA-directed RNA polymerase beta' subunit